MPQNLHLMASPKSETIELSAKQAAAFCGMCHDTFLKHTKSPNLPPSENGKTYRSDELGEWMRGSLTFTASEIPITINGAYERARKDRETADKLAMENRGRRGEFVEAAEIEETWALILMRVRARILGTLPAFALLVATESETVA